MAVKTRKMLVPSNKYSIKCPYSMTAKYITVHNTYNDASAENEAKYMISNNSKTSFHVVIDDKECIQTIPFDRNAWHAGDGKNGTGNRKTIGIEICYSKSGGERFIKAEKNAAEFIAGMLKERNWGIDHVKKHQDWSGKYCPHRTLDMGWTRFLNMVQSFMNGKPVVNPTPPTPSSETNSKEVYRVRKSWNDPKDQIGAYEDLENAKKACKAGYTVYNSAGKSVYANAPTSPSPLKPTTTTPPKSQPKVVVDKSWGVATTKATQKLLKTSEDGIVSRQPSSNKKYLPNASVSSWKFTSNYKGGSSMIKALQKYIGTGADGYFGKGSVIALQKFLKNKGYYNGAVDGSMGGQTVEAWQKYLNSH